MMMLTGILHAEHHLRIRIESVLPQAFCTMTFPFIGWV